MLQPFCNLVRGVSVCALCLLAIACAEDTVEQPSSGPSHVTHYANGLWYDGAGFVARDVYVKDGIFSEPADPETTHVIDLAGGHVVPAFADAHHHTVLCDPGRITQFIDAGVVYAGILNARVHTRACQGELHGPQGVEILSALAGITARDAHPSQIGLYFLKADEINGEWVHYVDSVEELDTVWPKIAATQPDIIKVFLSYSEDYEQLRFDTSIASWYRGVDPNLIPAIVERAHADNLRVSAHVMSAHDFEVGVMANVDIIAHMPGFAPGPAFTEYDEHPYLKALLEDPNRYRVTPAMAEEAALRGVSVMTTVSGGGSPSQAISQNFETLRNAGVTLLIGSDRGEFTSVDEAEYLVANNLMESVEALNSLTMTTPQALFPNRKLGDLTVGGEATFVMLGQNPLVDFGAIRDVKRVVKRGETLRDNTDK